MNPTPASQPSRRTFLRAAGTGAITLAASSALPARALARPRPAEGHLDFVRTIRGSFRLPGRRFRFAGTNNYYLHYTSHFMIDDVLDAAVGMGLKVIRTWGWIDGAASNGVSLQPEPYVYPEDAYELFDYAVAGARRRGLRLVIPLTNNWGDFGGMPQYVGWFGGSDHDDFYRRADIRACYQAYVTHFVNRRNRYTGRRNCDEPAIMTWELANEPRCRSDKSGDTLVEWADTMTRHLKRLAPRQLVAVGDEGFYGEAGNADYPYSDYEGADWKRLVALPAVDYGTVHLYPDSWGQNSSADPASWGATWIADHIRDARKLGKPVVIEEFGEGDLSTRDEVYRRWTDTVLEHDGDGDQFWILTARQDDGSLYPNYDGFRVTYPSSTATVLSAHAAAMASR